MSNEKKKIFLYAGYSSGSALYEPYNNGSDLFALGAKADEYVMCSGNYDFYNELIQIYNVNSATLNSSTYQPAANYIMTSNLKLKTNILKIVETINTIITNLYGRVFYISTPHCSVNASARNEYVTK